MAESNSGSVSLSQYRPILYLLTGVAATAAVVYIHEYLSSPQPSQTSIRRRNAVRRQRRNETDLSETPSYRAITHLEQLESHNGVYGTFRIETEDGRRVESGLLPSLLATRDQLMEEVGVPRSHAERMREMMEDTFLESFLALDFPPEHTLVEGSAERNYLVEQLQRRGISRAGIERALVRFNDDPNFGDELRRRRQNGERVTLSTHNLPDIPTGVVPPVMQDGGETVVDDQSVFSWRDGNNESPPTREGQNLLNLLYHIAEDQARRDGYIHRGVTCNSCGAMPIQGIRYRCANCIDYDLCETCEAMGVHIKTHLFYKVRIPAPFLGNPRQSQPVWYPGKPAMLPRSLPRSLAKRLMKETNFDNTELEALWDQFRCLANYEWADDPNKLGMAIDRKTFDRCFVPNTSIRPPPPSLIYDRMFAFYDTNGDNLIGFEEFLKGLASFNNKSADERMRRIFRGYDIDGDGYVERKDFLRMFRAYYALSRELTRDMVAGMEDDFLEGGARDVILGSQPISSAFPGSIPSGEASRIGEGKRMNREGDLEIVDNEGVLRQDGTDTGDRHAIIGDSAVREQFGRVRPMFPSTVRLSTAVESGTRPTGFHSGPDHAEDEEEEDDDDDDDESESEDQSSSSVASDHWPPAEHIHDEDIVNALGAYVPLQEVTDPVDRARIGTAVYHRMRDDDQRRIDEVRRQGIDERWRRRVFYTDEEDGATAPEGYERDSEIDGLSDEDALAEQPPIDSHPPSPRSRSSSKVRFQDDINDDYEVRSIPSTSSRSIPVGERWGGFEIPEVERDVGKEILYQVTQQGLNELLDILFKPKEDLLMEVHRTRAERERWAREIELVQQADLKRWSGEEDDPSDDVDNQEEMPPEHLFNMDDKPLEELLQRSGYSIRSPSLEPARTGPVLAPPSLEPLPQDDHVRRNHLAASSEPPSLCLASPGLHDSEARASPAAATEQQPDFDPTLPQFRPSDETTTTTTTPHDSSSRMSSPEEIITAEAEDTPSSSYSDSPVQQDLPAARFLLQANVGMTAFFPPPHSSPSSTTCPEAAEASAPPMAAPIEPSSLPPQEPSSPLLLRRPSKRTLRRYAFLNKVEREAKERGGSGAKLNLEEFSRRMNQDRGRRLGFVGSWIEMASF